MYLRGLTRNFFQLNISTAFNYSRRPLQNIKPNPFTNRRNLPKKDS